jgi:ribose 5-phosphate isomerase A
MSDLPQAERAKRAAAVRALDFVEDGMRLGLGSGSTARWFVELLARHLADTGKRIVGVPTSSATQAQAEALGIPLATLDDTGALDLTVDGADEFDGRLRLVKGGGAALLQEKIVAAASARLAVIADETKQVETLGAYALPVEIVRFGWRTTAAHIARRLEAHDVAGRNWRLREQAGAPLVTEEGHHIIDLALGRIGDPAALDCALNRIPGVVENGLFVGMATIAIIGSPDGSVRIIEAGA